MNWKYFNHTIEAVKMLKKEGYTIIAIEQVEGNIRLDNFIAEPSKKYALIFGHEVKGVDQEVVNACDAAIEIPQFGTKHSLNISVCAGIVIWDFYQKLNTEQK